MNAAGTNGIDSLNYIVAAMATAVNSLKTLRI